MGSSKAGARQREAEKRSRRRLAQSMDVWLCRTVEYVCELERGEGGSSSDDSDASSLACLEVMVRMMTMMMTVVLVLVVMMATKKEGEAAAVSESAKQHSPRLEVKTRPRSGARAEHLTWTHRNGGSSPAGGDTADRSHFRVSRGRFFHYFSANTTSAIAMPSIRRPH